MATWPALGTKTVERRETHRLPLTTGDVVVTAVRTTVDGAVSEQQVLVKIGKAAEVELDAAQATALAAGLTTAAGLLA